MTLDECRGILREYHKRTGASHYHSSLSVLPILLAIKAKMRPEDECILSKAHAITAHKLVFDGVLPDEPPTQGPFGSLGTALPYAVGRAFMKPQSIIYVVTGDGEWDEGSNWEAYFLIKRIKIFNIEIYIDFNGMQGMRRIQDPVYLPPASHIFKSVKGPHWSCHYWGAE